MPNKKLCVMILNRNLKAVTESLAETVIKESGDFADCFIVESGSKKENLPKYPHWWANDEDAIQNGLRVPRGFNYGFLQLQKEEKFKRYDHFLLLCNDVEFETESFLPKLVEEFERHPKLGILTPLARDWGEKSIIGADTTKYFWYLMMNSWLIRREFIEAVADFESEDRQSFLFDGTNFRGYGAELEVVAKAYANEWAAGITSKVIMRENTSHLIEKSQLIQTNPYEESLRLAETEGRQWMRHKYGFNSRWSMQLYTKLFYDRFFDLYPTWEKHRII